MRPLRPFLSCICAKGILTGFHVNLVDGPGAAVVKGRAISPPFWYTSSFAPALPLPLTAEL